MKKRRRNVNKRSRSLRAIRLWSYEDAAKAVPYLRSVVGSLREHWLVAVSSHRSAELLAKAGGRPTRDRILAEANHVSNQERSEARFNEDLEELMRLDVFLLDPVRGIALIPFRKEDDLAWYVFDQFDEAGLSGWRFHNDPLEECRPLSGGAESGPASAPAETVG
jgi:hypothetical protein